mmetsp:Transcript_54817/g.107249  ORF Transcript_54817/g.107249 Transcript_54817/m.107249 type:complete len:120 (-) Transcript_54817:1261-1620(-)
MAVPIKQVGQAEGRAGKVTKDARRGQASNAKHMRDRTSSQSNFKEKRKEQKGAVCPVKATSSLSPPHLSHFECAEVSRRLQFYLPSPLLRGLPACTAKGPRLVLTQGTREKGPHGRRGR